MKKLYLIFSMLIFGLMQMNAQCPGQKICLTAGDTPNENFTTPFPDADVNYCDVNVNCAGLITEYLIVSNPSTIILGSVATTSFDPDDYPGECFSIIPVCYDLGKVQNLVEAMNNSGTCCSIVNSQTPEGVSPDICDGIKSLYSSGSQVTNMNDVLAIFGAFGSGELTFDGFLEAITVVNDNGGTLGFFCLGIGQNAAVAYCVNPVIDFTVNAYEIISYDVNRTNIVEDSTYTIQAVNTITASGTTVVDSMANIIYHAGFCIELGPEFEVKLTAEFEAEIGPCPN